VFRDDWVRFGFVFQSKSPENRRKLGSFCKFFCEAFLPPASSGLPANAYITYLAGIIPLTNGHTRARLSVSYREIRQWLTSQTRPSPTNGKRVSILNTCAGRTV